MQSFLFLFYLVRGIISVLIHYHTAVNHCISSVLRDCSYIKSVTLTRSRWKTVTVGKTFLLVLS